MKRHERAWDHMSGKKAVTRNLKGRLNVPSGRRELSLCGVGKMEAKVESEIPLKALTGGAVTTSSGNLFPCLRSRS